MRGTLQPHAGKVGKRGIIPAYAGNTSRASSVSDFHGDHPRVCGEHSECETDGDILSGSSPRMRGTHFACLRQSGVIGIIPAYAGNTMCQTCPMRARRDHPRICGEHMLNIDMMVINSGSSPHMRGTHQSRACCNYCKGIIPAYAGNTCRRLPRIRLLWDHPRICGEHKFRRSKGFF